MILVILVSHLPCVTTDNTVECLDRTNDTGKEFAPEARTATLTVIENHIRDTISNLTDTYTSHCGGNEVVDGRRLYLASRLPHQRTAEGIGYRLPEIHTVAACGIEV